MAAQLAGVYNPFFLYAGAGLGKTHLLQAIASEAVAKEPQRRLAYLSAEAFTNELIRAIGQDRMDAFRGTYRQADLLLVDNIQYLAGKPKTQEELFYTLETLQQAGKQIVLAADRPPKEVLAPMEPLGSRLVGGLIVDIQPPDFQTRLAILRQKTRLEGWAVPDEVLAFIAERYEANGRQLQAALLRLVAYSGSALGDLTVGRADAICRDAI